APITEASGRVVACLGLSVPTTRFRASREELVAVVSDVARRAGEADPGEGQVVGLPPGRGARPAPPTESVGEEPMRHLA
ncbi:MAG TPA: hypothetical protein VE152_14555, partial [Acidimicrobiales bacterium]|nr:hypothetical protein [Acidimicrobiales bacterium]